MGMNAGLPDTVPAAALGFGEHLGRRDIQFAAAPDRHVHNHVRQGLAGMLNRGAGIVGCNFVVLKDDKQGVYENKVSWKKSHFFFGCTVDCEQH
jgi:hypothetical protein